MIKENSVPKICRFPGYTFPQAVYQGETASGSYRVIAESGDYQGPALLERKYARGIRPERSRPIKDLVVIRYDTDGLHLAKEGYSETLRTAYYAHNRPKRARFLLWEKDWRVACSQKPPALTPSPLTSHPKWFEIRGTKSILPVREITEVQALKGDPRIFPASLYYQYDMPRSFYKADGEDRIFPAYFNGDITLKNGKHRHVGICLHGFTSPAKWHFGVLKHILGLNDFGGDQRDKDRWEAFEGAPVEKFDASPVVRNCRANKENTSCDEAHCREKHLFPDIHPLLQNYCRGYLRQAVTFFSQETDKTDKKVRIWQGNPFQPNTDPVLIEVKCTNEIRNTEIALKLGISQVERDETLILRGYSYDWQSAKEPTLHLCIITLYAGQPRGTSSPVNTKRERGNTKRGRLLVDGANLSVRSEK